MHFRFKARILTSLLLCITAILYFFGSSWNLSISALGLWESRLCACPKCLTEGDSCFTDLINEAPNPFMSNKYRISEDDFKWWKPIQGEKRNFTFYNTAVEKVFQMFPQFPDLEGPSPDRCRSCAVVGNSGNLKGSRYGPLIDSHNIVIRINRGPTKGFEADVGTKTTHHVIYPESATKLDNTTHLLFFPFKTNDFLWLLKKFSPEENGAVQSERIANKDLVIVLNPAFMKYVHEAWLGKKGHYPSTGFLTLALSMHFCDEVNVFGFGADRDGNWDHYFERLRNKNLRTGGHPGKHEYELIEKLHKKKKIQFFKGW